VWPFWAVAALFVLAALAFVLVPLWRTRRDRSGAGRRDINVAVYRDQLRELQAELANGGLTEAQFATAKAELEARLAQDALLTEEAPVARGGRALWLGLVIALAMPVTAFGLYARLGTPAAILPESAQAAQGGGLSFEDMLVKIEAKVADNPEDGEARFMLGRAYVMLDRWKDAEAMFAEAIRLLPEEPVVIAHYAEALAINAGRNLTGQPMALVQKALALDPNQGKALELAGVAAFGEGRYADAAQYWERLLQVLQPDDPYAQEIGSALAEARQRAGIAAPAPLDNLADSRPGKAAGNARIAGVVSLSPALQGQVQPDDVVFIFARSGEAGPPLAALRARVADLPLNFTLDESMAMSPQASLATVEAVSLVARISRSGQPQAAPGDLEGKLAGVKVGAAGVQLLINQTHP